MYILLFHNISNYHYLYIYKNKSYELLFEILPDQKLKSFLRKESFIKHAAVDVREHLICLEHVVMPNTCHDKAPNQCL